jgi:phosphoglycolate phosphatase
VFSGQTISANLCKSVVENIITTFFAISAVSSIINVKFYLYFLIFFIMNNKNVIKMAKYKHIIWDWNGTLFDDAWLCVDILNQILKEYHLPTITTELYQQHFSFPVENYYRRLGFDFSNTHSFDRVAAQYMGIYNKRRFECKLRGDAFRIVDFIDNHKMAQSILSAYHQNNLKEMIAHFKIDHFFTSIVGLDNYYAESKIDIGKKLVDGMKINPEQILLIGDTTHDFEVAQTMNIQSVLIPGGHQKKDKLISCGAVVLESVIDIQDLIEKSYLN